MTRRDGAVRARSLGRAERADAGPRSPTTRSLIFGFAQAVWLILARDLPPIASSMSVMLIPVLGTVSGAWWLGEALHWQDGAAIVLVLLATRA